jgi:hypothetical protein
LAEDVKKKLADVVEIDAKYAPRSPPPNSFE